MTLLTAQWPLLAGQLAAALHAHGEAELADQVPTLRVVQTCGCDDDWCQSFYTAPRPPGRYGAGLRTIPLDAPWPGYLIVNVVDAVIVFVEVLHRPPLD